MPVWNTETELVSQLPDLWPPYGNMGAFSEKEKKSG